MALPLPELFFALTRFFFLTQRHSNASQSLCEIIRLSRDQMFQVQGCSEPDPLLATLEKYTSAFASYKAELVLLVDNSLWICEYDIKG